MNYIIYQVGGYWQSPSTYRAWQQPVDKSRIASTWFGNWLSNPSNVFGSINQTNLSPFSASTVGTLVCAFIVCYLTWYDSLLHELPDSISHSLKQVRGGKLHSGHTNESPVTMKKQSDFGHLLSWLTKEALLYDLTALQVCRLGLPGLKSGGTGDLSACYWGTEGSHVIG